jgi:outer membrane protein assembly factor BamB
VTAEPHHAVVAYPGGLRASWRWTGSGQGAGIFALSEAGGPLTDLGTLVDPDPDGPWTVRVASAISDEPAGLPWDTVGQLVVKFGFHVYGLDARTGELRWSHRSATPVLALFGSPRLPHVLVQSELETFALEPDGAVGWRVAHSDVVIGAALLGGRLVLESFSGLHSSLDAVTGRSG